MDTDTDSKEKTIESEFVRTMQYIDVYLQQKTDLFLQHYVLEPADFLFKQVMILSVIVTLLATGTLALVIGVILFIATIVPLWAALLISGGLVSGTGAIIAYKLTSNKIILNTPVATERNESGNP